MPDSLTGLAYVNTLIRCYTSAATSPPTICNLNYFRYQLILTDGKILVLNKKGLYDTSLGCRQFALDVGQPSALSMCSHTSCRNEVIHVHQDTLEFCFARYFYKSNQGITGFILATVICFAREGNCHHQLISATS